MKSNQALTILFWHRKSKADSKGFAPIICRISIDGSNEEFSIAHKVHIDHWDIDIKRVRTAANAKAINSIINRIQNNLETHFTVLKTQYESISALMLKNTYKNLPIYHKKGNQKPVIQKTPTLLELTDIHIKNFTEMVDKKLRSKETLRQWKATKNKLIEFITYHLKKSDLDLSDIDYSFAAKFYNYLIVKRTTLLKEAAAKKQIKNTKQILSIAETNNWISKNPFAKFKCGHDEPEIIPLELFEVKKIWYKELNIDRLIKVRDAFIFQCFTGFAYQDIYNLSPEHIVSVGADNEKWFIKERGKTKVNEMVPILPIVQEIIEKYKKDPYCKAYSRLIPVNSNFRYNCYLKELSDVCGLGRSLNSHLARHTFADMMLNVLDFPLEDVSKMLGHKTIRTTQRYARVKKSRIGKKMRDTKNMLFDEYGKLRQSS